MQTQADEKKTLKEFTTYLLLTIGPWVASHLRIKEEATPALKAGVVWELVEERHMTANAAATLVGASERWVFRYLEVARARDKAPDSVRLRVLDFFGKRYPAGASVAECHTWLERQHFAISMEDVGKLLDALEQIHYLVYDGHHFTLRSAPLHVNREQADGRMKKAVAVLRRCIGWLERYVCGKTAMLREIRLKLPETVYLELQEEIQELVAGAIARAVQKSLKNSAEYEGDPTVEVDGALILSATPDSDSETGSS